MDSVKAISFVDFEVGPGFWADRQRLIAEEVLPYQWEALNDRVPGAAPSHAIENLRIAAGLAKGEFRGFQFQDSDVAKWIEAASYSLASRPDPDLRRAVDEAVELVGAAQEGDGYIQSYYSVAAPGKRWTDLEWGHELYCGGHLIEAAVAHNLATGSRRLLDIMLRYVDCVDAAFGTEEGKRRGYDGHPEIELALFKLYRLTRDERHLALARYFVDERGRKPCCFDAEREALGSGKRDRSHELDYFQAQEPLREQRSAVGHAVRGAYLYCAMADYLAQAEDGGLREALGAIWESATRRRMYVTGGLGSQGFAERHTVDYDLPGDTAYAETCASIGLVMWAWRMLLLDPDSRYADVLERALYNGVLSGMSADGKRFFYVNPLEATPRLDRERRDHEHVRSRRFQWFGCACCPPNLARLVASIGGYAYAYDEGSIWAHNYVSGKAAFPSLSGDLALEVRTRYPWEGRVELRVISTSRAGRGEGRGAERALRLRIPSWCSRHSISLNGRAVEVAPIEKGYAVISRIWEEGDLVELELDMSPRLLYARPEVRETIGQACVQRGPFIFCAEEADNGPDLHLVELDPSSPIAVSLSDLGFGESLMLRLGGRRILPAPSGSPLYGGEGPRYQGCRIALIPYFQWANREDGEMRVWLRTM